MEAPAPPVEKATSRLRGMAMSLAIAGLALGTVTLLGLRAGVFPPGANATAALRSGTVAPDFALPTLQGGTLHLAELRGQPVWITFWASWCPPCRVEMPDAQALYQSSAPGRYEYVAINMGEDSATAGAFVQEGGYTFPIALDVDGETSLDYGVMALPMHVFIDENGIVREVYAGILSRSEMAGRVAALW